MDTCILPGLPKPDPDVERFRRVLQRGACDRVPLVELAIAEETLAELHGGPLIPLSRQGGLQRFGEAVWQRIQLWRALGYDYYRVRAEIPFQMETLAARDTATSAKGERHWVNEHEGVIKKLADCETYPWPAPAAVDFAAAEAAAKGLPEGMGLIGFSGGVLEWSSNLLGLEGMMLLLYDDPDLVRAVVDRVGQTIYDAFRVFCEMERSLRSGWGTTWGSRRPLSSNPSTCANTFCPGTSVTLSWLTALAGCSCCTVAGTSSRSCPT